MGTTSNAVATPIVPVQPRAPVPAAVVNVRTNTSRPPQPRRTLTQEEKDRRRREGLCLYCGNAGHIAQDCPRASASRTFAATIVEETTTGPTVIPVPVAGTPAPVTACSNPDSIPENPLTFASLKPQAGKPRLTITGRIEGEDVSILVDCAADGVLVDEKLARRNPHWKQTPLGQAVVAIDGREIVPKHKTKVFEIPLELPDFGLMTVKAVNVPCGGYDIALGIDWLQEINPDIDFQALKIQPRPQPLKVLVKPELGSPTLESLRLAATEIEPSPESDQQEPDLQSLPALYQNWIQVFSKEKLYGLPPHRPGLDHRIELTPGCKLPRKLPYRKSKAETEVEETYINDMLSKGWIRLSTSLCTAPIMFVGKRDTSEL